MNRKPEIQFFAAFAHTFRPAVVLAAAGLCLVFFIGIRSAGASEALILDNPHACYNAESYLDVLWDKDATLTIDQVRSETLQGSFYSITDEVQIEKKLGSPLLYWYRLVLRQPQLYGDAMSNAWALDMRELMFTGNVQLYIEYTDEQGEIRVQQRDVIEQTAWNFLSIPMENTRAHTVYLRMKTLEPRPFTIKVCGAEKQLTRQRVSDRWLGLYFGIILTMALLNWFLFIFLRDKSYLWYVVYQGFLLTFVMLANNIIDIRMLMGWGINVKLIGAIFYISLTMLFLGAVQFSRHFLLTAENAPGLDRLLHYLVWSMLASIVAVPIFLSPVADSLIVRQVLVLAFWVMIPVWILLTGFKVFRKGFRPARFFLVAWGLFALGGVVSGFSIIGLLPRGSIALHGFEAGTALEAIVLSLALVDRMRILQEERKQLSREKQTAEAAAKMTEERLRFSLEATGDGVWDFEIPSGKTWFSPECYLMLGYQSGELNLSLEDWSEHLHPDDAVRVSQLVTEAVAMQREYWGAEVRVRAKDGDWRWILMRAKVVEYDRDGAPLRMLGTHVDITDRKLSEQRMFHADKMAALGQIMAGIAHEINNPNNFIAFNLPLLKEYLEAVQPVLDAEADATPGWKIMKMPYDMFIADMYKMVEDMQYGSSRISGIVDELKNYIRSHEKGELTPHYVSEVLEHVKALASKQVQKMVRHFSVSQESDLPRVMMNSGRIEQVLINLLINAAQAADKDNSQVSLHAGLKPDDESIVQFIVEDNGSGIPDDIVEKIFDPFFTTKRQDAGTGLGLSISQRIVEEHNGKLSVTSTPGEGTVFILELPVAPQETA